MNAPFSVMRDTVRRQVSTDLSKHKVQVHPTVEPQHDNGHPANTISTEQPLRKKYSKGSSFASFNFVPKMGHAMEDWTTIPDDHHESKGIFFNSVTLPFKWVVWTSKALSGLPPHQSLRERLCNQSASLGSVAGLYLVIAISGFFIPPVPRTGNDVDKILVDIFGVLMFLSAMSLTVYICLALTVMYPLLESLPDFAAMEAYQSLADRWGGYENFLFNIGCQSVLLAMIVAATVIYNPIVLYVMLGTFAVLYFIAAFMTREFFIAIDPITSVHMGLCNAPLTIRRAKALSQAIQDRHREFIEDEENLAEYAAMHYMDPDAKKMAALRAQVAEEARDDAAKAPRRPSTDRNELQPKPKYHVNPRFAPEPVVTSPEVGGRAAAVAGATNASAAADSTGECVNTTEDNVESQQDEKSESVVGVVTDFVEANAGTKIPTLEELLLGEQCLLVRAQAARVSVADCGNIHRVLVAQGCMDTNHLLELMQFTDRSSGSGVAAGVNGGSDRNEVLRLLQRMGIGAFHAMALVKYIDSLQAPK